MGDLHCRAAALLKCPRPLARIRPGVASADSLVQRYIDGKPWDDPELQRQLSVYLEEAETSSSGPVRAMGLARDAQTYYESAAAVYREILAEVSARPG